MSDRATPHPDPHPDRPGSAGEHVLQDELGTSARAERFHADQMCDYLVPSMQEFVGRMTMAFVATADAAGECDSTLRAGPAGFLRVLDEHHVAWPEYRGNGVMASLGNLSENPHVGLLMVDFTDELIGLHVNGSARLVDDAQLRREHPELPRETAPGRRAELWVEVTVEEAYIHCRKHIPRLVPVDRTRAWGTDDVRRKGGDHFGVTAARREAARASAEVEAGSGAGPEVAEVTAGAPAPRTTTDRPVEDDDPRPAATAAAGASSGE